MILVDGVVFKVEPWKSLSDIERNLFPDEKNLYFTNERFYKRDDGYYCLVIDLKEERNVTNLVCMPQSKGRSSHTEEVIPDDVQQKLREFFYPDNRELGIDFSWLK